MKHLWIVAVAVACGGTKVATTPVTNAHDDEPVGQLSGPPSELAAPRPDVDISALVPDPTEEARWPLTMGTHPVLEPHFDIAGALAQPGIGWLALCQRGVQNRHLARDQDLAEYLHAWCSVADHDTRDALYRLGLLHASTVLGLSDAIKHDCADILADHGDSSDVEGLLSRSHLMDHEVVDLLAAAYFEVGRSDDAFAMNLLATNLDRLPRQAVQCRRLVRGIVLGHEWQQPTLIEQLHGLVRPKDPAKRKRVPDATCEALDAEIRCWRDPVHDCAAYLNDGHKDALLQAYLTWPPGSARYVEWSSVVERAVAAAPLEDAYRLAIPAIPLAMRTSMCRPEALVDLRTYAHALSVTAPASFATVTSAYEKQLGALFEMTDHDCLKALESMQP